jgi:hypothetical protein
MSCETRVAVVDKDGRVVASVDPSGLTRFSDVRDVVAKCFGLPPSKRVALIGPGGEIVTTCRRLAALAPSSAKAAALMVGNVPVGAGGWRADFWRPL